MRLRILTIVAATIVTATLTGAVAIPASATVGSAGAADKVSYIVIPHPDDEFQVASLTTGSPDNYQVTITMTHGEQTAYCDPGALQVSLQPWELRPNPLPTGKWSPTCDAARLNSWVGYMTEMSKADPAAPGAFIDLGDRGPFPANGVTIGRDDGGRVIVDRTAHVWLDQQGRGALVAFNLGDGDLTSAEVAWAIKTVRDNRGALGLNTTLPNWNILGAFSNTYGYPGCAKYDHADHRAVHVALWETDFGMRYQAAATCKSDPDAVRSATVDAAYVDAAFNPDGMTGAHQAHYGWLNESAYAVSRTDQTELFMAPQSFWVRYSH